MIVPAFLSLCLAVWSFVIGLIYAAATGGAPLNGASVLGILLVFLSMFLVIHGAKETEK